jgi:serine/threonine protein kinase
VRGSTISTGQYDLLELLGEGGVGQVYAARDRVLGRHVAIKTLRSQFGRDREFIARFYSEAQRLGELNHPNITTLFALHLEGQEPFMVMELVRGQTLEALLSRVQRLPLRESLGVVAQTVSGLTYAHRVGIIHRDIKPANLFVSESGLLKIMDFGIARVRGSQRLTRAGQMFGTLLYASPEQIRGGDVDERSDLYSLAVVLYEMLAGTPPFRAENDHALMTAHLDTPPLPLAGSVRGIDPGVDAALMRALAKKPEDRFASVEEFGHAIGATAIRGEAPDILQRCFAAALRDRPAVTRLMTAQAAGDATRFMADDPSAAGLLRRGSARDGLVAPQAPRQPTSTRLPITLLGAVVVVLLIGLGYIVLSPNEPTQADRQIRPESPRTNPSVAMLHVPPPPSSLRAAGEQPAAKSPPPARPETPALAATVDRPTAGAPSTIPPSTASPANSQTDAEPPPSQSSSTLAAATPSAKLLTAAEPPPSTASPANSRIATEPPPSQTSPTLAAVTPPANLPTASEPPLSPAPLATPAIAEPGNQRPAAVLTSLPPVALPTPPEVPTAPQAATSPSIPSVSAFNAPAPQKPDLQGTVSAVKSASTIRVDGQWIDLYGVNDPTSNRSSHVQAMISYLKQSQGAVDCYRRAGGRYQCYTNGADLGLMALRGGIARPMTDAPSNYTVSPTSAR